MTHAGTHSCELPHVALVLSSMLHRVMDDGAKEDFLKNDVMMLPPEYDGWSVSNEPCTSVQLSKGSNFFK